MVSGRETGVELPWAADRCPCVEKLRTVLPFAVGTRDSVVQLVLTHQRVRTCSDPLSTGVWGLYGSGASLLARKTSFVQ